MKLRFNWSVFWGVLLIVSYGMFAYGMYRQEDELQKLGRAVDRMLEKVDTYHPPLPSKLAPPYEETRHFVVR